MSGTRKRQAQVSEGVKVEMKGKWRRDGWADGRMGAKVDPGLVKCSELAPRGKDLPVGHNSDPFLEASSGPLRFLVPTAPHLDPPSLDVQQRPPTSITLSHMCDYLPSRWSWDWG